MKVTMVGTGYVGLVSGACLADVGCSVGCVDRDPQRIAQLHQLVMPIYEPGLTEVVQRTTSRNTLRFSNTLVDELHGSDAVFICVGTPPSADGSVDLSQVEAVAREIGRHLDHYSVIVVKSTVPVGTSQMVRTAVAEELDLRGVQVEFDVASNPEFLKEGAAIADFMKPDRIVVGVDSDRARAVLAQIYRPFVLNGRPLLFMDVRSAELTKYAANAMLATRISFMNLMAQLCERTGADIGSVRQGMSSDPRIGQQFLYAGIGYGGSCFPKDVQGLISTGATLGMGMGLLEEVEAINNRQKLVMVERVSALLGSLAGRRITVWGLAFKPNTDDVRDAPALVIIQALVDAGAEVVAYDPVATDRARVHLGDICTYELDAYAAVDGADALILATEWPEFRTLNVEELATRMRGRLILDGRNVLDAEELRANGFVYQGVGLAEPVEGIPS